MSELNVIEDGALLIRNGIVEDAGPSRRVENLAHARGAREIDACGRVVMPAFVDADAVLVYPSLPRRAEQGSERTPLRVLSKRRLEAGANEASAEWARYGTLTVGAHTGYAVDLANTVKVLRTHQVCQGKPLRIRSIFSPRVADQAPEALLANLKNRWLATVRRKKLAAIVEFSIDAAEGALTAVQIREAATAAAELGYSIRIRARENMPAEAREMALAAGALALLCPPGTPTARDRMLADAGCVHVLSVAEVFDSGGCRHCSRAVRAAIDEGIIFAVASGYRLQGMGTLNPQYLLHLACGRFGLSVEEAIVSLTYNASCSLRMSHVTGSLEPGKAADVLIMDVPDYHDLACRAGLTDVHEVIRAGQTVFRRSGVVPPL